MIYRKKWTYKGITGWSEAGRPCGRGKTNRKCWVNMSRGMELGMGLAGAKVRLVD